MKNCPQCPTVTTAFCPTCGAKHLKGDTPEALLHYLRGQRNKAIAWQKKYEQPNNVLSASENEKRLQKARTTTENWDAWIAWVEEKKGNA
jgi:hypothetical protein